MFGALRVLNADQAKALLKFIRYQHSLAPSNTFHKTLQSYGIWHQPGNIPFVSLALPSLRSLISLSQINRLSLSDKLNSSCVKKCKGETLQLVLPQVSRYQCSPLHKLFTFFSIFKHLNM